jgi:hypothetical protein
VRLPGVAPLGFPPRPVGVEDVAVLAGRPAPADRRLPKWCTNTSSAQTTRYPSRRIRIA